MTIRINLDETKERIFRAKAMEKYGFKKGAISLALEEAIDIWINLEHELIPKINNPTDQLSGLLKGVTETSVELQHLGKDLFIEG
ncbi:MAG: hypothetical protein ACW98K_11365 [Candidatus Kariarchaeaceae archaeon]|jgi:hypothetical protein